MNIGEPRAGEMFQTLVDGLVEIVGIGCHREFHDWNILLSRPRWNPYLSEKIKFARKIFLVFKSTLVDQIYEIRRDSRTYVIGRVVFFCRLLILFMLEETAWGAWGGFLVDFLPFRHQIRTFGNDFLRFE